MWHHASYGQFNCCCMDFILTTLETWSYLRELFWVFHCVPDWMFFFPLLFIRSKQSSWKKQRGCWLLPRLSEACLHSQNKRQTDRQRPDCVSIVYRCYLRSESLKLQSVTCPKLHYQIWATFSMLTRQYYTRKGESNNSEDSLHCVPEGQAEQRFYRCATICRGGLFIIWAGWREQFRGGDDEINMLMTVSQLHVGDSK